MKKLLFVLILCCALFFAVGFVSAEGTKTIIGKISGVVMIVPESAPEFLDWQGQVLGANKYPNGNALMVVDAENEAGTVVVRVVWLKQGDKFFIIDFAVAYLETQKMDVYEDNGYFDTCVPSTKLQKVMNPHEIADMERCAGRVEI